MRSTITRTAVSAGVLSLALAAPAMAHITASPGTAPSDGYTTQSFQIPHGCEESPTTQMRIQIPPSVPSATPAVHPLWNVSTKEGKKDPVEMHGEKITSGVSEIVYTAKQPLAPDRLDLLPVSLKMPAGKEGESVYFPIIQKCEQGETRWIQIPAEGESEDDLEDPAAGVVPDRSRAPRRRRARSPHGGRLNQRVDTIAQGPPAARWVLLEVPFEGVDEDFHAAADELEAAEAAATTVAPPRPS